MSASRRLLLPRKAWLSLAAVAGGFAFLVAGCGGSNRPSVASLATTTSGRSISASGGASASGAKPSAAAFAVCLGQHGFAATPGSAADAGDRSLHLGGVTVSGNVDPASSQFQAAMQACRRYLPGGGPPSLSPAQAAEWARAMTKFAVCMRANGVPGFPDPSGDGRSSPGSLGSLDVTSSFARTALKACESLEPSFGPRITLP